MDQYTPTNQEMVLSNKKQLARLSYKVFQNLSMCEAIKEHFENNNIYLTRFRKEADRIAELGDRGHSLEYYYDQNKIKDLISSLDPEYHEMVKTDYLSDLPDPEELKKKYEQIARAYYVLKGGNRSIVAAFTNLETSSMQPMLIANWYTKHKMCNVWNFRKSQLIRKKYREYLETAVVKDSCGNDIVDENGDTKLLIRTFQPIHMVLTLRHENGLHQGERFYARALINYFTKLRRLVFWKKYIYAGEYGLEIKSSKNGNGLHIHLHSFLFLSPTIKVEAFKEKLIQAWYDMTDSMMVHFETIYYYEKYKNGKFVMEPVRIKQGNKWQYIDDGFEIEEDQFGKQWARKIYRKRKKKIYIDPKNSTINEYISGVMECIKYHFKNDCFKDNGSWDVPLMMDVLNNSVHLRFYSRFGKFYNEEKLNFDFQKEEESNEEELLILGEDEEGEAVKMGNVSSMEERLINPFTFEKAVRSDYDICVIRPERLEYRKTNKGDPDLYNYDIEDFQIVAPIFDIKEIVKAVCTNRIYDILLTNNQNN